MEKQRIAAARDGGVEHCAKTTTRQKKIVGPVDATVKTIYSAASIAASAAQISTASASLGPIVKSALTFTSIRPASGRALVRVAFGGVLSNQPMCHLHPSPAHTLQATLWVGAYEDQVLPGGGSA